MSMSSLQIEREQQNNHCFNFHRNTIFLDHYELPQYLDHTVFKTQHDRQLLQWLNNRPEDWSLSWGGATVIYGWGKYNSIPY